MVYRMLNSLTDRHAICQDVPAGGTHHAALGERLNARTDQVKTVLAYHDARNKTFLAFKDSPENPLGRLPVGLFGRSSSAE